MRKSSILRNTNETKIKCEILIDGSGKCNISTGSGFFDHMLELFCRHGSFDINLKCDGDSNVDYHHSVEDCGIVIGRAFSEALGDRRGIVRYGSIILPMDETLALVAIDISGRAVLSYDVEIDSQKIGEFDSELVEEFFVAITRELGAAIHIKKLDGKNSHHIAEAVFKAFGRALSQACSINEKAPDAIPSTKGTII